MQRCKAWESQFESPDNHRGNAPLPSHVLLLDVCAQTVTATRGDSSVQRELNYILATMHIKSYCILYVNLAAKILDLCCW